MAVKLRTNGTRKKGKGRDAPMPLRWEMIIDLLPQTNWEITAAARKVGYSPAYIATRLTPTLNKDVRFCEAVEAAKLKLCRKHNIRADKIIRELMRIGFARMTDFAEWDGDGMSFTRSKDLTEEQAAAVESIRVVRTSSKGVVTTRTELKLHSKLNALEQLGKIAGVFEQDNNQKAGQIKYEILNFTLKGSNGKRKEVVATQ